MVGEPVRAKILWMLMDGRAKTPDNEMVEADDLSHVLILLEKMDKREATILRMRSGRIANSPDASTVLPAIANDPTRNSKH